MRGGIEVPYARGIWRGTNITQDKETGIGDWTDEQIIDAIREGKRPDGSQLDNIMPYGELNILSDEDSRALVAFLRTIKPVRHEVLRPDKIHSSEVPPAQGLPASTDHPVSHGKYLARIMRCRKCHTPWGGNASQQYIGGNALTWRIAGDGEIYASNLTSDEKTGIGAWTDQQIKDAFLRMKKPDGSLIRGPMAILQGGWSQMDPDDVEDVVAFLRSLPPVENPIPRSTFKPFKESSKN